jgi:hypothetical protein
MGGGLSAERWFRAGLETSVLARTTAHHLQRSRAIGGRQDGIASFLAMTSEARPAGVLG